MSASSISASQPVASLSTVGENPVRLWGLTMAERNRRMANASQLRVIDGESEGAVILSNAGFAYDPAWLRHIVDQPGMVLTSRGVPALAHAPNRAAAKRLREAMLANAPLDAADGLNVVAMEDNPTIVNKSLRKRETPFLTALEPGSVRAIERASYFGAYKGVTDILTKYLWPEWALVLTRIAARIGMTPNMVTAIGAAMCLAATFAFAWGHYWAGLAMGLVFMVLDTVDGKLARCTITSSWWGNIFDHGIDLVHPPFWWWFWATGLAAWNLEYDSTTFWLVQGAIQGGYIVQRLIEGVFMRRNSMMHIHVWRRFDSQFRLITARRNPNMVILFVSLLFARPDLGLIVVAIWTVLSLVVHSVQLVQAEIARARKGAPLTSWLAGDAA
ncbi:CDP-alcohol phosphatidyltransferase family protein [Altererythrobacter sp. CAU 1778]